jgi:uncharacterized cupin superfamily protein
VLTSNAHLTDVPLEPLPSEDVVEGHPLVGSVALAAARGVEVGLWEITAGTVIDVEADEVFVVLSGRGRVMFEDSSFMTLAPGSVVRLRAGDRTTWTISETLRKVYVLLPPAVARATDDPLV